MNTRTTLLSAPRPRRGAGGMTAIEMLIVVAVLAVLAALLMPAINAARQRAAATRCQNNLRQLGLAIRQYMNDNNNDLPPHSDKSNPTNWKFWSSYLRPYIPVTYQGNVKRMSLYCPNIDPTITTSNYTGYSFNGNFYKNDTKNQIFAPTRYAGQYPESKLPIMWEDVQIHTKNWDGGFPSATGGDGSNYEFAFRHNGKGYLLMLDGHVEAFTKRGNGKAINYPEYFWKP